MGYTSFYGGRKGASFVIVKSYPDIPTMTADFSQGNNLTAVGFDEYVIISAYNKNHPDNGKVFKRGYDFGSERTIDGYRAFSSIDLQNEIIGGSSLDYKTAFYVHAIPRLQDRPTAELDELAQEYEQQLVHVDPIAAHGAIYVGTIVGPAGLSPAVQMTTYEIASQKQASQDFDVRKTQGAYQLDDNSLIPGKYEQENQNQQIELKFNDKIQWYCTSIRGGTHDDGIAYVGFKVPYTVFDFITESVPPYQTEEGEQTDRYADTSKAEKIQDDWQPVLDPETNQPMIDPETEQQIRELKHHPYYEKWKFSIPHGVKGDAINNFRVIVPPEMNPESNDQTNWIYGVGTNQLYQGFDNDIPIPQQGDEGYSEYIPADHPGRRIGGRQILVYDYYNYDETSTPAKKTYYIGKYNEITNFTIQDNGTITIAFTNDDTITYPYLIKWIKTIAFDNETDPETGKLAHPGLLKITYNTYHTVMEPVMEPELDPISGDPVIDPETQEPIMQPVINPETGEPVMQPVIDPNTQEPVMESDQDQFQLDWVKDIRFDNDGTVTIDYTQSPSEKYNKFIRWIDDISLATQNIDPQEGSEEQRIVEGTFKINYNTEEELIAYLKWVNGLTLSNNGQLTLHYSGNGADKIITQRDSNANNQSGNFIKWINNVLLNDDGTLSIVYNTGAQRDGEWKADRTDFQNKIRWVTNINFNDDGNMQISYNTGPATVFSNVVWISEVTLNDNGEFKINYTNNTSYNKQLRWPTKVELETSSDPSKPSEEGTGSQKVKVTYTNSNPTKTDFIGNALNYIMKTEITEDRHLVILHSDPVRRNGYMNSTPPTAYEFNEDPYDKYKHNGYSGWLDLGSIYSDSGILIGLNIDPTEIPDNLLPDDPTQEEVIAYLNQAHPNGLTQSDDPDLKNKIVTVGVPSGEKIFYGFNYEKVQGAYKGWYYLGTFSNVSAALSPENDMPPGLQQGALWFVIEENYFVKYNLNNGITAHNSDITDPTKYVQQTVFNKNEDCKIKLEGTISSVIVTMNNVNVTNQYYNSSTYTINIPAVSITGNIEVQAS